MKLISARSSCAPAPIRTAKREPGDLRRALEVEDAKRRAEVPVRLRLEVEHARLAPRAHDDVVGGARCRRARSRAGGWESSPAAGCAAARRASSSISSCLIFCARCLFASKIGCASRPCRLARATSSPAVFCSRLRPSSCGMTRRRCASSVASCSSSASRSTPRARSRWSLTSVDVVANERGSSIRFHAILYANACTDPEGRVPRRRPRHPLSPRDQGAAEGDAAARRQADDSVRRRRSGRVRRLEPDPRHRPRQERHRGSLRRLVGARGVSRAARQARAARGDPQDLEPDQRQLRAPGRAARPRPRGAR